MEYLEGETLQAAWSRPMASPTCSASDARSPSGGAAHRKGIVDIVASEARDIMTDGGGVQANDFTLAATR